MPIQSLLRRLQAHQHLQAHPNQHLQQQSLLPNQPHATLDNYLHSPLLQKVLLSQVNNLNIMYTATADSSQYAILTIHLYIPPVHVCTTYCWIILGVKRPRCSCEGCSLSDCGVCNNCCDMKKFGGPGRKKQRCMKRKCQFAKSVKVYKINYSMTCLNLS